MPGGGIWKLGGKPPGGGGKGRPPGGGGMLGMLGRGGGGRPLAEGAPVVVGGGKGMPRPPGAVVVVSHVISWEMDSRRGTGEGIVRGGIPPGGGGAPGAPGIPNGGGGGIWPGRPCRDISNCTIRASPGIEWPSNGQLTRKAVWRRVGSRGTVL